MKTSAGENCSGLHYNYHIHPALYIWTLLYVSQTWLTLTQSYCEMTRKGRIRILLLKIKRILTNDRIIPVTILPVENTDRWLRMTENISSGARQTPADCWAAGSWRRSPLVWGTRCRQSRRLSWALVCLTEKSSCPPRRDHCQRATSRRWTPTSHRSETA